MFTLYTTSYSSNGRKTVALCHELGLAPGIVDVNVYRGEGRSPDFLAKNPWGKVPTLVDADLQLWESNAILIYISEAHGECRFWAREPRQRANIARWLFWESSHWQPVLTRVLGQHAGHVMVPHLVSAPQGEPEWNDRELTALLRYLDAHLAEQAYLAGDAPTLADVSVIAMTIYFRRFGFPAAGYPAFGAWYERMHARPAWQAINVEPWET